MSPIFVRPVREQLEHDRLIRHLLTRYKRKVEAVANAGDEQIAPVKLGPGTYYPDIVLMEGKKLAGVVEVETAESVNNLEAMAQWVPFSKSRVPFHLYVPVHVYDVARRFCESHQALVTEIWTYRPAADGFDLVRLFHDAAAPGRKHAKSLGGPAKALPLNTPAPKPASHAETPAPTKAAPKPATKAEPAKPGKSDTKPPMKVGPAAPKPVAKAEPAAPKPMAKAEPAAPKPMAKAEPAAPKPLAKAGAKAETKTPAKAAAKPAAKVETKSPAKVEPAAPKPKPNAKSTAKAGPAAPKPVAKAGPKVETKAPTKAPTKAGKAPAKPAAPKPTGKAAAKAGKR